jgi:FkbM family methyltransferase
VRAKLPALLHRLERTVPAPARRWLKRSMPAVIARTQALVLSAAPEAPTLARIADGPLRGRNFTCRLRYEADYIFGTHEPAVTHWLEESVQPGSTVFDIGAHAGYTALIAARLVGEAGRVVAFEPNPRNRDMIALNLTANADISAPIRVEPYAVSDACGMEGFGGEETTGRLEAGGALVAMTSLDAYVERTGVTPALIKMDIEGGERRAFDGMADVLGRCHPTLIVEIHDAAAHERFAQVIDRYKYHVRAEGELNSSAALPRWSERRIYLAS